MALECTTRGRVGSGMAVRGIMVVRDEGDIIGQVLGHLLTWLDALYIYDTGSGDGTWEIVREVARQDRRVVALGSEPVVFHNGVRAMVFDRVRERFREGDWVARLDADEIYHGAPAEFLRERVERGEGRVFAQLYEFLITKREAAAWERGEETLADRARPIEERRRRYVVQAFPEPRLFRYRRSMRWPPGSYVPLCGGVVARERMPVRHYRWRDPVQAAARCAVRMEQRRGLVGAHWDLEDWREWLANDEDPRLLTWEPGMELPEPGLTNHLPRGWRGVAARAVYGTGLVRVVDRVMPRFPAGWRPEARVVTA